MIFLRSQRARETMSEYLEYLRISGSGVPEVRDRLGAAGWECEAQCCNFSHDLHDLGGHRPRAEAAADTFLNCHAVKWPSKYLYLYTQAVLKRDQRSLFSWWAVVNVRCRTGQGAKSK